MIRSKSVIVVAFAYAFSIKSSAILITKKKKNPELYDPVLRVRLAKGMGYNYYGEPAWPIDLLYIFHVVIFRYYCV